MASYALAVAWLSDFVLTPALCASVRITTLWDVLTLDLGEDPQKSIPLLHGLRKSQARIVAIMSRVIEVPAGRRLISDGETGKEMYVVLEGRVEAQKRKEDGEVKHLRVMNVGDLCGEVGPLSGGLRTADVIALEDTQLLVLSWERIDRLTRLFPLLAFRLFRNLTRIIGARLRQTSEYAVDGQPRDDRPATR